MDKDLSNLLKKMAKKTSQAQPIEAMPVGSILSSQMTAEDVWAALSGSGFRVELTQSADSFRVVPTISDEQDREIIKAKRDELLLLAKRKSDESQYNSWDDLACGRLLAKIGEEFAALKSIYDSPSKRESAYDAVIQLVAMYFESMAEAIRLKNSKSLWNLSENLRWLTGQIKHWSRSPSSQPPRELFLS